MSLVVTHTKVDNIADDPADLAAGKVLPSDWNATHTITGTVGLADVDQTAAYAFSGLGLTHISDATQSTTSTTGSLTAAGGLGVAKNSVFGGSLSIGGSLTGVQGLTMLSGNITIGTGDALRWGAGSTILFGSVNGQLQISNSALSNNSYLFVPASGTIQLGQAPAASPVAQTLQAQGGTGSNVGGATITYQAGQGTGTGLESHQTFKTPIKVGSGSGAQTMLTALDLFEGVPAIPSYAFASLPTIPAAGMLAYVTDSNTIVWGATVAGGSTNPVLAWYNGAAWTVLGK